MKTPWYRAVSSSIWLLSLSRSTSRRTSSTGDKARSSPSSSPHPRTSSLVLVNRPVCKVVGGGSKMSRKRPTERRVSWDEGGSGWCTRVYQAFREMGHAFVRRVSIVLGAKDDFRIRAAANRNLGRNLGRNSRIFLFPSSLLSFLPRWIDLIYKFRESSLYPFARIYFVPLPFLRRDPIVIRFLWPIRFCHRFHLN